MYYINVHDKIVKSSRFMNVKSYFTKSTRVQQYQHLYLTQEKENTHFKQIIKFWIILMILYLHEYISIHLRKFSESQFRKVYFLIVSLKFSCNWFIGVEDGHFHILLQNNVVCFYYGLLEFARFQILSIG